jgi:hypothetical protein
MSQGPELAAAGQGSHGYSWLGVEKVPGVLTAVTNTNRSVSNEGRNEGMKEVAGPG